MFGGLRASRTIHRRLISSVLGTTLRWLDSTPVARVIARCTQDMQSGAPPSNFASCEFGLTVIAVDSTIPDYLSAVITIGISIVAKFIAIIIFSPVFLLPGVALFVIGAVAGQIYIKAQLSVKREMSNARSPVLSHFGAAIAGIGAYSVDLGGEYSLINLCSLHSRLLCPEPVQARVFGPH